MRKGVIWGLVFLLSINFVLAYDLNVTNVSVRTNYAPGEMISGSFNLNLINAPINLYLSSSFGTMSVRDFLKANGKPLSCENVNCSDAVVLTNAGETSKTISLNSSDEKKYALVVNDTGVSFNQLNFNLTSNFPESNNLPLQIIVGNGLVLNYNEFSDNYNRQVSYGCFDSGLSSYDDGTVIDQYGFCEKMNLSSANKYLVGANISGSIVRNFKMQLKNSQGMLLGECTFNGNGLTSFTSNSSCVIQTPNVNNAGNYYVCIKDITAGTTPTDYKIRSETSGSNCGYWDNSNVPSTVFTRDFAIYAKLPTYKAASSSGFSLSANSSGGLSGISSYVSQNYPAGCVGGCIIPFSVKGVSQSLGINTLQIDYNSATGPRSTNKIYEISYTPRKFNFSGDLSLNVFNWSLLGFGNKSFTLNLLGDGTKQVLNASLVVLIMPIIDYVTPTSPVAGVPMFIYAFVRNSENVSRYVWDFGDNSSTVTNVSYVLHNYKNISNYLLSLTVGEGNKSVSKSFNLTTISPREYLNQSFGFKRIKLNHASSDLLSLPSWYQNAISKSVDLDFYQTEINNAERDYSLATSDQDFLDVANKLSNLVMPWAIVITDKRTSSLIGDYNQYMPSVVQEISRASLEEDISVYKPAILNWQLDNVVVNVTRSNIRVFDEIERSRDVLSVFELNVKSNSDDESYFVIQKDFSAITFSSDSASIPKKVGSSAYVTISPKSSVSFKFYLNGSDSPVMFISPKLSLLSLGKEVGVCNFNMRCEKNLGETAKNCRSDCRPVGWMWFWLVMLLLIALVAYTILQVWYKRKYEEYLFKDRNELYNLWAFIENGKVNKLSEPQMMTMLAEKGWDKDQIKYALLKSAGKNTGMFEIIPVDKLMALFEKKKPAVVTVQKPVAPTNPYPMRQGVQRPPFNPLRVQQPVNQAQKLPSQNLPNQNKTTTTIGQQNKPKN